MPLKRSFYVEANDLGADGHPIDAEVERRTENEDLVQRIMTAQEQLLAVLDNKRLYLAWKSCSAREQRPAKRRCSTWASSMATCRAAATP
jgi:hypothetical protein